MKTLLQINVVVNSGSTGRIAEEIGRIAIKEGWKSYIAYGRNKRPSKSELIKIGNSFDVKLHGIKTRIFDKHGFGSRKATIRFIEQIRQINPDIIHLHNIHGYYLNIDILFKYLATSNIPVVWTLHDCWALTGHCSHFEFAGCEKWKTQCFSCPQKKEYPKSLFFDNSKQNYTYKKILFNSVKNLTVVAVSDWLNKKLKDSILNNIRSIVIKNGIDLDIFKESMDFALRTKHVLHNKFVILGVASTWTVKKGLNDFIQLSRELSDDCRIVLIGLSREQIKQLPPGIIGIERTEDTKQLASYYSMADVYVNPTYEDTFPTTNLESLACGTPIVTYKTGGSIESVSPNSGFIINKGDIKGILAAVQTIKQRNKSSFGYYCRKDAVEKFDKEESFNKYFLLYKNLTSFNIS